MYGFDLLSQWDVKSLTPSQECIVFTMPAIIWINLPYCVSDFINKEFKDSLGMMLATLALNYIKGIIYYVSIYYIRLKQLFQPSTKVTYLNIHTF